VTGPEEETLTLRAYRGFNIQFISILHDFLVNIQLTSLWFLVDAAHSNTWHILCTLSAPSLSLPRGQFSFCMRTLTPILHGQPLLPCSEHSTIYLTCSMLSWFGLIINARCSNSSAWYMVVVIIRVTCEPTGKTTTGVGRALGWRRRVDGARASPPTAHSFPSRTFFPQGLQHGSRRLSAHRLRTQHAAAARIHPP